MSTKTEYNTCKVCEKQNVKFTYWESTHEGNYRTNFDEKSSKAVICSSCHEHLKEGLKKQGKEICSTCWNKTTWSNFDYTPYTKPVDEECSACKSSNDYDKEQQNTQDEINENQKKLDELYEDRLNRIEKDFNDIYNTCASCNSHIYGTSYYFESEPTKHYCINCKLHKERDRKWKQGGAKQHNVSTPGTFQQPTNCSECKKTMSVGDKCYVWPDEPDKKYCQNCGEQRKLCATYLEGIEGGIDLTSRIENSNKLLPNNKKNLLAAQQIKNGERVDIDNINISEEDKQGLREFQQKVAKSAPLPKPNEGDKYVSVCSDCKEEWSHSHKIPACCPSCKSKKIKVYDDKGFLQLLPSDNQNKNKKDRGLDSGDLAFVIIVNLIFWPIIIWLIVRWWRKRKNS